MDVSFSKLLAIRTFVTVPLCKLVSVLILLLMLSIIYLNVYFLFLGTNAGLIRFCGDQATAFDFKA